MSKSSKQAERHVEAVLAALDVLENFQDEDGLTIKELIDRTGFTRNRVMRLAGTLAHRGFLIHDPTLNRYTLGPQIMVLGKSFERHQGLIALVRPILKKLVFQTGESASFYVREGADRVVLAREEGTQPLRFLVTEGQRIEIHAGAGGNVLLAHAPKDVRDLVLNKKQLNRFTKSTLVDPLKLARKLEKVRSAGFAVSLSERVPDAGAIAAPVFDQEGRLVGALAIAGPATRISRLAKGDGGGIIRKAAAELSSKLGYKPKK